MDPELIKAARSLLQEHGKCSAGFFQKYLRIPYALAVQLQDEFQGDLVQMGEQRNSPFQGAQPDVKKPEMQALTLQSPPDHAYLPPSSASSWSKCGMWATMNARFPQDESAEGIEGTAAHWVSWEIFAGRRVETGMKTPNGQIVTEEMIECGELVSDVIRERIPHGGLPPFGLQIEQKIPIHSISPHCFGTPDLWALQSSVHIEIIDVKFGHRFVDEFWNSQGLLYLSGIVDLLTRLKLATPDLAYMDASFTVIQPRCFYKGEIVRTHTFTLNDARSYWNQLAIAAEASMLPEPTATTNDHCCDCPGKHSCSALQLAAYADAEYSNKRSPLMLPPIAAALELRYLQRALDRLQARVDGLKEQTISNIRAGRQVNYFRVEPGFGRQVWTIPDGQVVSLGKLFGAELSKPGVLTPKQAEKAGVDAGVVKANSFIPSTGFRLIPENPEDAAKTFAGYVMGPVECDGKVEEAK